MDLFLSLLRDAVEAFWLVFVNLWWLFAFPLAFLAIEVALKAYQRSLDARAGLPEIDRMTGERFEEWLANFFRARGYSVKLTPRTGDIGVDLDMHRDGQHYVVQAKCWKNNVGTKAVQEIYSGKAYYRADKAIVVTNSYFTHAARHLAREIGVELWDRARLKSEILSQQKQHGMTTPSKPGSTAGRRA